MSLLDFVDLDFIFMVNIQLSKMDGIAHYMSTQRQNQ